MPLAEGDHISLHVGDDALFAGGGHIAISDPHGIFKSADPSIRRRAPSSTARRALQIRHCRPATPARAPGRRPIRERPALAREQVWMAVIARTRPVWSA
jgi:hypothetical protein